MNRTVFIGRLVADPTMRKSQGENPIAIASFSVAVDRRFKREGQPEADFFDVTAFGKTAEFIEKYFVKGSAIAIDGRLQQDSYTNKDGQNVSRVVIMAEEVGFAGPKVEAKPAAEEASVTPPADDFIEVPDIEEELPF